ncbi:hypothetical protein RRG08_055123 [Elysia crispata]|uniref:Uncharacterized protein n=1 Tax=Elysia crispata TaxID=231223 RepID=A0AAE1AN99_9GAST|nr:hypothetical protein RRG08_055123 [Elysia crispata]
MIEAHSHIEKINCKMQEEIAASWGRVDLSRERAISSDQVRHFVEGKEKRRDRCLADVNGLSRQVLVAMSKEIMPPAEERNKRLENMIGAR